MAWTASDLTAIETAIRTAITEGIASVSIAGQEVQVYTLKELREMRAEIAGELAISRGDMGIRLRKIRPAYE